MKKRIDMIGFKLDPDDKDQLIKEAQRRNLTISSLMEKIVSQHLEQFKGLPGERRLLGFLEAAIKETSLALVDDGRITPDEAVRIARSLIEFESEIFGCKDYRLEVSA